MTELEELELTKVSVSAPFHALEAEVLDHHGRQAALSGGRGEEEEEKMLTLLNTMTDIRPAPRSGLTRWRRAGTRAFPCTWRR